MRDDWRLEERDGLVIALCSGLERVPRIAHGFSTRRADGAEDFDLGKEDAANAEVESRRRRFLRAAGLGPVTPFLPRQVHGSSVVRADSGPGHDEADGSIWVADDGTPAAPSVRTADCVAILLVDRRGRAAAAVHAGWRGAAAGIAVRSVDALADAGADPGNLTVALGPAIGPCCYEVGPEVWQRVAAASGWTAETTGRAGHRTPLRLDLHRAIRNQLETAGIPPGEIRAAPWCTRCRGDLFFSYRRQGRDAGRMMASVGPAAASGTRP